MAKTLFYGNTHEEPQKFMGLSPRYNALSGFDCAENVLDFGGRGNANTSIWLCGWGENTLHGIFPKGSQAGLQIKDLGEQTLLDDNGGHYQGYRSHFKWDCGLSLRDWRYAVRICNIDTASFADIVNGTTQNAGTSLIRLMIAAANKIPSASNAINNPPENPLVQPPPHTQIQNEPQQQSTPHPNYQTAPTSYYGNEDKRSPFVFAILAIFFGWLGIHLFYINKKQAAVFVLAINLFAIFLLILSMIPFLGLLVFIFFPYLFLLIPIGMISWIQAIIALVITEEEFERRFVKKNTILPF